MKKIIEYKNKKNIFGICAAVVCILFNMNTLIVSAHIQNTTYAGVSLIILLLLSIFDVLCVKRKLVVDYRSIVFFVGLVVLVLMTAVVNMELYNILYLVIILEMFKALLLVNMLSFRQFAKVYVYVVAIMAAISILFFVGIKVFPALINLSAIRTYNSGNGSVRSYGVYYILTVAANRNTGFLSEPGDFQHYLNIALILNLFIVDKSDNKYIRKGIPIILSLAALTTFSSAGLVFLLLIWLAYLNNISYNPSNLIIVVFLLSIISIAILTSPVLMDGIEYSVNKLTGASTSSLSVRTTSILSGYQTLRSGLLFGNGINGATELMKQIFVSKGLIYDQTSTTSCFFAMFGVLFGFVITWYYLKLFWNKLLKKNIKFVSVLILISGVFFSINNERFVYELLYYIVLFYGIVETSKLKKTDSIDELVENTI